MKTSTKSHVAVAMLHLVALLPRWLIEGPLSRLAASLIWLTKGDMRRATEINLALCFPEMPEAERAQLARRSLRETVRTALELPGTWLQPIDKTLSTVVSISGEALLTDAIASGRGVIVLSPHVGNWEILGIYLSEHYPLTCMYRPGRIEGVDAIVKNSRAKGGAGLVPTNRSGVAKLLKVLKNQEVIGVLPDQNPDDARGGMYAPFYAEMANTMTLVPNLLQKTNAVAVGCIAKRIAGGRYEIVFLAADEAIYDKDLQTAVNGLNKTVENVVNVAPEQYQWEYKRFRRDGEGKKRRLYSK
ncbi:Lipid A biosynthesis lauroyltransferase [BD1-7 clade bacterium]|uniref:Lipid A biosynthesis lauroyltransferase n=1 Tax=BD1-7 clade bacterium TaxID=2029982 RepID=A0A5S9N1H6_9GAMM|nr:Lipid A biosynthesis lauroyltransferase [BD1-7 clade bacterium]CAA0083294.1 Lipid A biosynthesis lauroyltransferase [BD1-7 clade bacterium]